MSSITKSRMSVSEYKQLTSSKKPKAVKPRDNRSWDQRYRSKAEQAFAKSGWREFEAWLRDVFCGGSAVRIVDLVYEMQRLRLPGGWYTPDFMALLQLEDFAGRLGWRAIIEIKATTYHPSYRHRRSKIRAAAAIHQWDGFFVAWYEKGSWRFEDVPS